jgi:hypothetical protein
MTMMDKQRADASNSAETAMADDVKRILGSLDDEKLVDIIALQPTIRDVEEAALWLAGDADVYGAGEPLKSTAGRIVEILTADEDEEPRPRA